MSERIDHAAGALEWIRAANRQENGASQVCAQLAVASATLALVEQQRIANLIALTAAAPPHNEGPNGQALQALLGEPVEKEQWLLGSPVPHMTKIYCLHPDIAAALGIKEEK